MSITKKQSEQSAKLQAILAKVNQAAAFEAVHIGSQLEEFERWPTGVLAFDTITGGGLVAKKYIELWGAESCGKSTLALRCLASVQRRGKYGMWVCGEEFDDDWAKQQGVDESKLIKVKGLSGTEMLEYAASALEELHTNGIDVGLLVLDSIQTLKSSAVAEAGIGKEAFAGNGTAQMWGRFSERMGHLFRGNKTRCCVLGISQARENIGAYSPNGRPEPVPTQIRALLHWKSISVRCKQGERQFLNPKDDDRKRLMSQEFKLLCNKNKTAPPLRTASYTYRFLGENPGIDFVDEAVRYARAYDLLDISGPKVEGYGISVRGGDGMTGIAKFIEALRANPEELEHIREDVLLKVCGA